MLVAEQVADELLRNGSWPSCADDALSMLSAIAKASKAAAAAYSRAMRADAESAMASVSSVEDAEGITRFVERACGLLAPSDFDSYMLFMEWDRLPERQFYRPRRRVLAPLVADLQDLYDGRIKFLSVSMPPRTGKSTTCIFFLTFLMGNRPLAASVMSGHSDKLTSGFHREALSIIKDDATYRFARVFPDSKLARYSMRDETISLVRAGRFPTLTCRSIDGTLTGAVEVGRGGLLYCDDLVSDREEALSVERMDKLYQAYLNQLRDRMADGASQLFVATRWVPNDPIGRIQEIYGDDPSYRFAVLPALDEDDRSNFVYERGLGFSTEYYLDMRRNLVDAGEGDSWAAKYMGAPEWIGGLMFSADQLRFYSELPDGEPDGVIAACDTKDRGKDYAVLVVALVYGEDHYIDAVICDNSLPEVVEPRMVDLLCAREVGLARFESNSAGGRVADDVREACHGRGLAISVRKVYSTEVKETRILVDSGWVKERCLFREDRGDADYQRFMAMLTSYTTEGRNAHDDAPDAMSMLKRLATWTRGASVKAVPRII